MVDFLSLILGAAGLLMEIVAVMLFLLVLGAVALFASAYIRIRAPKAERPRPSGDSTASLPRAAS